MGSKKRGLILAVLLLVLASLVWAEEGCYVYKESMLYCFDLEKEDALEDCLGYEACELEGVFFEGKSCEDLVNFPECEEIFCKSSCDYEFLGKCLGGAVPAGKEYIWCSEGCCRFNYYGGEFCEFKESKWLCEVEAKNREVGEFNFDVGLSEEECGEICSGALILGEKVTEGLIMEEVSDEEIVPEIEVVVEEEEEIIPSQAPPPTPELFAEEKKEGVTEELEKGINMSWILFYFVLFLLLLIVFYLFYQRYKLKREREVKPKVEKVKRSRFFFRKKAIKAREERLRKIREEREHKRKEKERRELFGLFGFGEVKERKISHVDLLEKVAKAHELRKHRWAKEEKEERDIFKEIKKWAKKKEEKVGKSAEEEAKKVFEKLKKIIEKKG